jgi:molybdenum cofactor biosynthesis enzyme MoaA
MTGLVSGTIADLACMSPDQFVPILRRLHKEDIFEEYRHDPWIANYLVNWWEYIHREAVLSSYPWNVTIPIADVCNARCTFCTSWLEGTRVLEVDEIPKFAEVLKYARHLGIAGHGEPLAHPHCEEIFDVIGSYLDPRSESYIITNGVFLEKRAPALRKLNVRTYNISLNAATAKTHEVVMGLGTGLFERTIEAIRNLVEENRSHRTADKRGITVNISFVINKDNVHEMAEFIRLGNELAVKNIYLRTLNPQASAETPGLNYHLLPPYLHPDFERYAAEARKAMAKSAVKIITDPESWSAPVIPQRFSDLIGIESPPVIDRKEALGDLKIREHYARFYEDMRGTGQRLSGPACDRDVFEDGTNPFHRKAPYDCYFLYHDFIINDFNLRLIPCCYMAQVPGFEVIRFDGSRPFTEYWNSPAFVNLRERLREGPLFGACKKCPAQNVAC